MNAKTMLAMAIILVLSACGRKGQIDPAFSVYVRDFETKIGVSVNNVDIKFGKLKAPTIGVCYDGGQFNQIRIDPDFWETMDENGKEQLMYHELGHCVLGLGHNNELSTLDNMNVEGSIMNSYWFGNAGYYAKYKENYKKALKHNTVVEE